MSTPSNFTCISSTPTSKNDGFITKLQGKVVKTADMGAFGTKTQINQETYYIKMQNQVPVNTTAPLDLSKFRIQEEAYTIPEGPDAGKVVNLKWLFLK